MSRLSIFNAEKIRAFNKPPRFNDEQRQRYFAFNDKLLAFIHKLKSSTNQVCIVLHWGYFRALANSFLQKISVRQILITY